jgi:hypothetical protein
MPNRANPTRMGRKKSEVVNISRVISEAEPHLHIHVLAEGASGLQDSELDHRLIEMVICVRELELEDAENRRDCGLDRYRRPARPRAIAGQGG